MRLFDARTGKAQPPASCRPASPAVGQRHLWHENSRDLGFQRERGAVAADVFSLDARTGKIDRWTESETGGLDTTATREPELVRWKSFDGRIDQRLPLPAARRVSRASAR